MNLRGRIKPIPREHTSPRRETTLPSAWVQQPQAPAHAQKASLWLSDTPFRPQAPPTDGVCIAMLQNNHEPLITELARYAEAGTRLYLLTPLAWNPPDALRRYEGMLTRQVLTVPGTGIWRSDRADLWLGPSPEQLGWHLHLSREQASALRALFLHLFWHEATREGWVEGKQLRLRDAAPRPFDVPVPSPGEPIRLLNEGDASPRLQAGARLYAPDGSYRDGVRRLWVPPSGKQHIHLSRLCGNGAEIVWQGLGLPEMGTTGRRGYIRIQKLLIELSAQQAGEAAQVLDRTAEWSFRTGVQIGAHEHAEEKFWLSEAEVAQPLLPQQHISLPAVPAPEIRSLPDTEPSSFPEAAPLSVEARYTWTATPPRCPKGARPDPLHKRWEELDADWSKRLGTARGLLEQTDEQRGSLGGRFASLLQSMMGFQRTQKRLAGEHDALEGETLSHGSPDAARRLLDRLRALEEGCQKLSGDLSDKEYDAEKEKARQEQQEELLQRKDKAKARKDDALKEQQEQQDKVERCDARLEELDEQYPDAGKKERRDLRAEKKKLQDERKAASKSRRQLSEELEALEATLNEAFTFKPPPRKRSASRKKGQSGFIPTAKPRKASQVPDEALPQVGALSTHNKQRYLIISTWEELEVGEAEAKRLNAKLVAAEDA